MKTFASWYKMVVAVNIGVITGIAGIHVTDWKFWAILVPVAFMPTGRMK